MTGRGDRAAAAGDAAAVRTRIALAMLADELARDGPCLLGGVRLLPHQRAAVGRLERALREHGGALLADEVGLGKTYVALALAAQARAPLVVAPAALAPMWAEALRRSGLRVPLVGTERLSRSGGCTERGDHDLVIVDEAHHFRNPRTRRWGALAGLARGARLLLLSASPVHNRRADLVALLALFLGSRAGSLDEAGLAGHVVRRDHAALRRASDDEASRDDVPRVPVVRPTVWLHVPSQEAVLERILALPPPVPPADGGDGGPLVAWTLLRQWSSSVGALQAALRRRLQRGEALLAALEAGSHPTAAELRGWLLGDDAVQLAFPELLPHHDAGAGALCEAVRLHRDAVRALLHELREADDEPRAALLRQLRRRHAGERIVAFSQYADTVAALWRTLRRDPGVCALGASGAQVAGGALGRQEALHRFAPLAHGREPPPRAERIDLLLATDLLSEGMNLQDACVVVHLDLPWTPARLEQRVGRVARLGAPHAEVTVYAVAPPARAESLLGVERRLRRKWATAARAVGVSGIIAPAWSDGAAGPAIPPVPAEPSSAVGCEERLRAVLRGWLALDGIGAGRPVRRAECLAAAVQSMPPLDRAGAIVLAHVGAQPHLLAVGLDRGTASDAAAALLALAERVTGVEVPSDDALVVRARRIAAAWMERHASHRLVASVGPDTARLQRRLLSRLARVGRSAPLHERARLAPLLVGARRALAVRHDAGTERVLQELADAPLADEAWLRAVGEFGSLHADRPSASDDEWGIDAVLLIDCAV